jgi:hypothetical protein
MRGAVVSRMTVASSRTASAVYTPASTLTSAVALFVAYLCAARPH